MRIEQFLLPAIRQVVSRPKLAAAMFKYDKWGNPFAPESFADPYPLFELMRADGPITFRKMWQQWFVTGYDEAREVLSSDAFITANQVEVLLEVRPWSQMSTQAKEFMALWLLLIDPPVHTRLRGLVNRAFTPRRIAELRPRIEALTDELIDEMLKSDAPDVAVTLCRQLPIAVIADLLGLPRERWEWSRITTEGIVKLINPMEGFDPDELTAIVADMHDYWGSLADERLKNPQDDLMTALVQAEDEGDRLSRQELIAVIAFLMAAGHETTTNLLGNGIIALARNPEQRALVRNNPELWPNAVEEIARYDTSVKVSPRATAREVTIAGHTIPAGQNIAVQLPAANRDPRRFDRPNELILDRENPSPISFGHGAHYCLGANLARMELQVGLSKFVEAFGDYTIEQLEWKESPVLRGVSRLIVRPGN